MLVPGNFLLINYSWQTSLCNISKNMAVLCRAFEAKLPINSGAGQLRALTFNAPVILCWSGLYGKWLTGLAFPGGNFFLLLNVNIPRNPNAKPSERNKAIRRNIWRARWLLAFSPITPITPISPITPSPILPASARRCIQCYLPRLSCFTFHPFDSFYFLLFDFVAHQTLSLRKTRWTPEINCFSLDVVLNFAGNDVHRKRNHLSRFTCFMSECQRI